MRRRTQAKRGRSQPTPAPPAIKLAKAEVIATPPAGKKAARPDAKASACQSACNNAFWNQPQLTKVWDVAHLNADDERDLRDDLHD